MCNISRSISHFKVVGASGAGKTYWIARYLRNAAVMTNPPFEKVIYCFSEYQDIYSKMTYQTASGEQKPVEFVKGVSESLVDYENLKGHSALIVDDLIDEIDASFARKLFQKISHHRNLT